MLKAINHLFRTGQWDDSLVSPEKALSTKTQLQTEAEALYKKIGPSDHPFDTQKQFRELNSKLPRSTKKLVSIVRPTKVCRVIKRRSLFFIFDYLIANVTLEEKSAGKLNIVDCKKVTTIQALAEHIYSKLMIIKLLLISSSDELREIIDEKSILALNYAASISDFGLTDSRNVWNRNNENLIQLVVYSIIIYHLNYGTELIREQLSTSNADLIALTYNIASMATEINMVEHLNAQ